VRVRVALAPGGLGTRLDRMHAWLDGTAGADGRAMTPSGLRGVVNDAVAVYFRDPTVAAAFVRGGAPTGRPTAPTGSSGRATTTRRSGVGRRCIGRLNGLRAGTL
jgi:hypothetical protein